MNHEELIASQIKVKTRANELINTLNLIDVLSKYGKVEFEGAYSYDLMVKKDIDVRVSNANIKEAEVKQFINIVNQWNGVSRVRYFDETKNDGRREGAPNGYYVGIYLNFKDKPWKIDVWFIKDPADRSNYPESIRSVNWIDNCTTQQKQAMLLIKTQLYEQDGDYNAANVYRSVLEANAKDINDFHSWLEHTNR